jgi:TatD DNase family protein
MKSKDICKSGFSFIDIHNHQSQTLCSNNISLLSIDVVSEFVLPENNLFSAGIHPWSSDVNEIDWYIYLLRKLISHKNCIAIGECGLDYSKNILKEQQIYAFEKQIEISENVGLPLILHCVKAYDDLLKLKKHYNPKNQWIMHGFNKSKEMAKQLIESGLFLSFGKEIINSGYSKILIDLPIEKMYLETDAEDIDIVDLYKKVSLIKNIEIEELISVIYNNFKTNFIK